MTDISKIKVGDYIISLDDIEEFGDYKYTLIANKKYRIFEIMPIEDGIIIKSRSEYKGEFFETAFCKSNEDYINKHFKFTTMNRIRKEKLKSIL